MEMWVSISFKEVFKIKKAPQTASAASTNRTHLSGEEKGPRPAVNLDLRFSTPFLCPQPRRQRLDGGAGGTHGCPPGTLPRGDAPSHSGSRFTCAGHIPKPNQQNNICTSPKIGVILLRHITPVLGALRSETGSRSPEINAINQT